MSTASEAARYIVNFFQECGDPVTNLKLQKLLYYVQGWHLGLYGISAFDDDLQAWVHGPVQPGVYQEYREFRWNPINTPVAIPNLTEGLKRHIDEVLQVYGGDSAYSLERRTHLEQPWIRARNGLPPDQECRNEISVDSMREFFNELSNVE